MRHRWAIMARRGGGWWTEPQTHSIYNDEPQWYFWLFFMITFSCFYFTVISYSLTKIKNWNEILIGFVLWLIALRLALCVTNCPCCRSCLRQKFVSCPISWWWDVLTNVRNLDIDRLTILSRNILYNNTLRAHALSKALEPCVQISSWLSLNLIYKYWYTRVPLLLLSVHLLT